MTPLAFPFMRGGYRHELVAREGDVCLVERGGGAHYEIVVLRHRSAESFPNGDSLPAREGYPKTSEWGEFGWSYVSREKAEGWYQTICRRERSRRRSRTALGMGSGV